MKLWCIDARQANLNLHRLPGVWIENLVLFLGLQSLNGKPLMNGQSR